MGKVREATLLRVSEWGGGTAGILMLDRNPTLALCTLELPWKNNERNVSRIPAGRYECSRIVSPRFGGTYEIVGVDNRSEILIHPGNSCSDSRGCILVGTRFIDERGAIFIGESKKAFNRLLFWLDKADTLWLDIEDAIVKREPPSWVN